MDIFFLDDPPQSGVRNMAVDETLLEQGLPIFRFYRWNEATVSLGYFQRFEDRDLHESSRCVPLVRRRSGGGAIVHDRELTYSLVSPQNIGRLELYEAVHRSFIAVLRNFGVAAGFSNREHGNKDTFLCFQRLTPNDVVVRQGDVCVKILGSAQYRNRFGAVLQHGSLLLDRSPAAPELDGIARFSGTPLSSGEWVAALKDRLSKDFSWNFQDFHAQTIEKKVAFWEETRYADSHWIQKK